jgi:hypothetical protein
MIATLSPGPTGLATVITYQPPSGRPVKLKASADSQVARRTKAD